MNNLDLLVLKVVSGDLVLVEGVVQPNGDIIIKDSQTLMYTPVYGGPNGTQLVGMSMTLIDFVPTESEFSIANTNIVAKATPDKETVKVWESYKSRKLGLVTPSKPGIEICR